MATEPKEVETNEVEVETKVEVDTKELQTMIQEGIAKGMENQKKFATKFKLSESEADKAKLEKAKSQNSVVKFFSAISKGDVQGLREMSDTRAKFLNEGTGSAGGFFVPEEFEKSVNAKMDEYSQLRSNATVIPMGTDVKRLNEVVTDPTVSIVGEGVQIPASDLVAGEPVLTARKYVGLSPWSNEVVSDAELSIVNLLVDRYAERLAQAEQAEFATSATSGSEGLLTVTGTTAVDMAAGDVDFSDITFDYLRLMQGALEGYSITEAGRGKFYMSPYAWGVVSQTKPTDSGYYGGNPVNGWARQAWGSEVVILNEYPGSIASAVSTAFATYSDLSRHLFIGDRAGMTVTIRDTGVVGSDNLFEQDLSALRVVKRTANTTSLQAGIVNLVTAAV